MRCFSIIFLLFVAGCLDSNFLTGKQCDSSGRCIKGYVCDPSTNTCVRENNLIDGDIGFADAGLIDANDAGLIDANDAGLVDANDAGLIDANDAGLVDANDAGLVDANDAGLVDANDAGLVDANDAGLVDANDAGLVDANDAGLIDANDAGLVDANDAGLTDSDSDVGDQDQFDCNTIELADFFVSHLQLNESGNQIEVEPQTLIAYWIRFSATQSDGCPNCKFQLLIGFHMEADDNGLHCHDLDKPPVCPEYATATVSFESTAPQTIGVYNLWAALANESNCNHATSEFKKWIIGGFQIGTVSVVGRK